VALGQPCIAVFVASGTDAKMYVLTKFGARLSLNKQRIGKVIYKFVHSSGDYSPELGLSTRSGYLTR